MDVRGKARLKRRYVLVLGVLGLLMVFLIERMRTSDRKIDEPPPHAVTQPNSASTAPGNANAQVARAAAPATLGPSGAEPPSSAVKPSPDPLPTDRLERGTPKQSCSTGESKEPQSDMEVSALVQGYLARCPDKLFSAMDEIYQQESRDETWAAKLEEKIDQARGAAGARLKGVCHASLCRLDPDIQPGACNRADVNHSLVMAVSNTELEGEIVYRFNPCTRYFYTTVIPAWFVDPLRAKMGDGP